MEKELIIFNICGVKRLNLTPIECLYYHQPQIPSIYGAYSFVERTSWLENNKVNYVKQRVEMVFINLKRVANLCLYWVESEIQTDRLMEEMPDKGKIG